MNIMYRELVVRRKLSVVIGIILIMTFMISLSSLIQSIDLVKGDIENGIEIAFIIITLSIIVFEVLKCKVKYKYSIISDQIIIHKLNHSHENVVENIKFKDIIFIGKKTELNDKLKVNSSKKYVCSIFNNVKYCCIYKDGNLYRKFYFEPSMVFASKLQNMIKR